jgi:eukaryotic-like serine/threonine-protein kinase
MYILKKIISATVIILTACTGTPKVPSTLTPLPTIPPRVISTSTVEIIVPIFTPTIEVLPTDEFTHERVSTVDGMPLAFIPAGTFRMGGMDVRAAADEMPSHDVQLDAFWIDQLEVTNAMYLLCVKTGICEPPQSFKSQRRTEYFGNPEFNDYPVVYVTWGQAKIYCEWAGRRLPTEAEWERAGRGDDFRTFPWGEDEADGTLANFNFIVNDTSRVGSYSAGASPFGVLDMAGNVAEWVNDLYTYDYSNSEAVNPTGPLTSGNLNRVVRGGSLGDAEINIRVSKRSSVPGSNLDASPGSSAYLGSFSPRIGFRCAADD